MTYTITEAARRLDLSYHGLYNYVKEYNLGGDGKRRELTEADLEFVREKRYEKRKQRSKTYRLEEALDSLQADLTHDRLLAETRDRRLDEIENELKEIRRQLNDRCS